MGLNMGVLVKLPNMEMFGRPVDVTPRRSQPEGAGYRRRGIFRVEELDEILEDGATLTSRRVYLDVLDAEFAVMVRQGDLIFIPADESGPAEGMYEVVSGSADGGGMTNLVIQKFEHE